MERNKKNIAKLDLKPDNNGFITAINWYQTNMKTLANTILLTFLALTVYCQDRLVDQIKNLEGIWIAEDYLNRFDITKSSIKSKEAFHSNHPVGLRINRLEIADSSLNIGYSELHDHWIHPEISKYTVVDGDTIHEQRHFQINIAKSDSLNFYQTSEIHYFNYECKAYFSWIFSADTVVILYRPATENQAEETIRFKRISYSFKPSYLFPNPIYYYTRSKTLVGTYTLRDSLNKVISSNFQIALDGTATGYTSFKDKIFYFSTDIYCGPETTEDFVLFCSYNDKLDPDCKGYIYKRINEKTIQFHKNEWVTSPEGTPKQVVGKMIYKLTKK
ncbi:MAG: hypothetical protein ACK4ND_18140 [Cytophagaceae bacterium]